MKAVLDTNVLVSAFINEFGPPRNALEAWRANEFELVSSEALLAELVGVLRRRRLMRRYAYSESELDSFVQGIRDRVTIADASASIDEIQRDPDDNRVLEVAFDGKVDYIVSGDRDLLDLKEFQGSKIVTPSQFLRVLGR